MTKKNKGDDPKASSAGYVGPALPITGPPAVAETEPPSVELGRIVPEADEEIGILPTTSWLDLDPKLEFKDWCRQNKPLQQRLPRWELIVSDIEIKAISLRFDVKCKAIAALLDTNELEAILSYTHDLQKPDKSGNLYYEENMDLRKRGAEDRKAMLELWGGHMYYAIKGLGKLPDYKGTVYRGNPDKEVAKHYEKGTPIQWGAWSSTTSSLRAAKNFGPGGIIFKISIFTGKDIQAISFFPSEGEILLTPNHKFLVTAEAYEKDGFTFIDLVEMKNKFYYS